MKILYRLIFAKVNSRFFSDPNTLSPGFIHLRPFLWYFTSWVTGSYGRATDGTLNFFCLFRETQEKKTQQKSSSVLGWSPDCWKDHFPAFLQQGMGRVWTTGCEPKASKEVPGALEGCVRSPLCPGCCPPGRNGGNAWALQDMDGIKARKRAERLYRRAWVSTPQISTSVLDPHVRNTRLLILLKLLCFWWLWNLHYLFLNQYF